MQPISFLVHFALGCMLLFCSSIVQAEEAADSHLHLISPQGSERATSGAGVKIVTFGKKTHVVWQDANEKGEYLNQIRTLDHGTNQWGETFTLNKGKDNHARPVIAVDAEGFLHVVLSGHNTPVTYRRSVRPNDASDFTESEPTGDGTYPFVTVGAGGTLYMAMRATQRWNGVDLYIKKQGEAWQKKAKLVYRDPKLPGYAGFQTGIAWSPDRKMMHVVIDFYESKHTYEDRGVHQAVCHMQSSDGGETWQKADGTPIELPARPEQMDIIARRIGPQTSRLAPAMVMAQGSIAVDRSGHPYILYVTHLEKPGEVKIATADKSGQWTHRSVDPLAEKFPDLRPTSCRGAFSMDAEDNLHALLELRPTSEGWSDGQPTRAAMYVTEGKRLVWVTSTDGGKSFSVTPALPEGRVFNQANAERAAGFNQMPIGSLPAFVFFAGNPQYRKKGEVILNNVYFMPAEKD